MRFLRGIYFVFCIVLSLSLVSAVWWNPFTWSGEPRLSPSDYAISVTYLGEIEDKSGPYSYSPLVPNDFTFQIETNAPSSLNITRAVLNHATETYVRFGSADEYWRTYSTNADPSYPLVFFEGTTQLNHAPTLGDSVFSLSPGSHTLKMYAHHGSSPFLGGRLFLTLASGEVITFNLPAAIGQTTTVGTYVEGPGAPPAVQGYSCVDSDGMNASFAGNVSVRTTSTSAGVVTYGVPTVTADSCSGNSVTEYTCAASTSNSVNAQVIPCANGCANGACLPASSLVACTAEYAPVCGANGIGYSNTCAATVAGTTVACTGTCPCTFPPIACDAEYAPVCGANGIGYSNTCAATVAGTTVACTGTCPCASSSTVRVTLAQEGYYSMPVVPVDANVSRLLVNSSGGFSFLFFLREGVFQSVSYSTFFGGVTGSVTPSVRASDGFFFRGAGPAGTATLEGLPHTSVAPIVFDAPFNLIGIPYCPGAFQYTASQVLQEVQTSAGVTCRLMQEPNATLPSAKWYTTNTTLVQNGTRVDFTLDRTKAYWLGQCSGYAAGGTTWTPACIAPPVVTPPVDGGGSSGSGSSGGSGSVIVPAVCGGCMVGAQCVPIGARVMGQYCGFDRVMSAQKVANMTFTASCENNYECQSNSCSDGRCVNVAGQAQSRNALFALMTRVFCKLAHPLNVANYDLCVAGGVSSTPA